MRTLLFVHGAGVRAKAFDATMRSLHDEFNRRAIEFSGDHDPRPCYRVDECRVKLLEKPRSVRTLAYYFWGNRLVWIIRE